MVVWLTVSVPSPVALSVPVPRDSAGVAGVRGRAALHVLKNLTAVSRGGHRRLIADGRLRSAAVADVRNTLNVAFRVADHRKRRLPGRGTAVEGATLELRVGDGDELIQQVIHLGGEAR